MWIMIRPFPSQRPITLPHAVESLSEATNSLAVTRTEDSLPCQKKPLLDHILGQMNSVHTKSIPLKFKLILSSVPRSFIGPVPFIFSEET
jgi:hypothetical protein